LLLHRDEHPDPGRAPGHRDGHRHRPDPRAADDRRRPEAVDPAGGHRPVGPRDRVPDQRRGSRHLHAQPRPGQPLPCTRRARRAGRQPCLRGLPGTAELRLDDRQADRPRPRPRDRDLPHAGGAERDGGRWHPHQHPAAAADHGRHRLPAGWAEHPLPGEAAQGAEGEVTLDRVTTPTVMAFLELSIPCTEAEQPRIEQALEALAASDEGIDWSWASFREVADQDWERAWMDQYEPLRFGEHTWIVPWNHALPDGVDAERAAVVRLDPGLAFGSGTHPTTALCLAWLDRLAIEGVLQDARVLDFGCGSGILALAALKLGAQSATGVDNDPQALAATADNAERNDVDARLHVYLPGDEPVATYPVVVANILASALIELADTLAARVAPGGRIALSGI